MEKVDRYLYKRYLDDLTEDNIKKIINSLDDDNKDTLENYAHEDEDDASCIKEIIRQAPSLPTLKKRITLHELEDFKQHELIGNLYDVIKYYLRVKKQKQKQKQDSYEDYIKNFPEIKANDLEKYYMNTDYKLSQKFSEIFSNFTKQKNKNIFEDMLRDMYIGYKIKGNEFKCLYSNKHEYKMCRKRVKKFNKEFNEMVAGEVYQTKHPLFGERRIADIISLYAFNRRKSTRKSTRKSARKSARKSVRKSRRKSVRKSRRKSTRKSRRKSVRKQVRKSR
jgi:hypothetical protein